MEDNLEAVVNTHESGSEGEPGKGKGLRAILTAFFVLILFAAAFLYFYTVRPTRDSFTYELGQQVSTDPYDYIEGFDKAVGMSRVDLSDVRPAPGVYEAKVLHFPFEYSYEITIVDTIPPKIEGYSDTRAFVIGDSYYISDVINRVLDQDTEVSVRFSTPVDTAGIDFSYDDSVITFTERMKTQIDVSATDSSGNTSRVSFTAIADTAPVVTSYSDYYVAKGTNGLLVCESHDDADGNLTKKVVADIDPEYYLTTGTYDVVFRSVDSNGLEGDAYATVHVYDPATIQDMINTDRIDGLAENVIGAINPYDAGYLVEDDIEKAKERLIPAIVRVSYETPYVRAFGSGYILKISDTGIIIGTNQHVVDEMKNVDIHFYDGTTVKGRVEGCSKTPDIAFVRVNLRDISEELLKTLKTVHINLEYFKVLSSKPFFEIGMYCTDGDGGEWLTHYGNIQRKTGYLAEFFNDYDYAVTEVSVDLIPGVSGSMIFDAHGNFICMAAFYWMNGYIKENYGVSLDSILDFYEAVFGKRLEYY